MEHMQARIALAGQRHGMGGGVDTCLPRTHQMVQPHGDAVGKFALKPGALGGDYLLALGMDGDHPSDVAEEAVD